LRRLALIAALIVLAAPQAQAQTKPNPGDSCSGELTNTFTNSGGSQKSGNQDLMFCDGTNWTGIIRFQSTGNVGIGNTGPGALLDIGKATTTLGTMRLEGNTSGYVQLQPAAAAGSWHMTLPTSGGTSGYVLSTDGAGVTSWVAAGGGGATLNGITAATANQTGIANAAYTIVWNWDTLAGGTALSLNSASTAAASNAQKVLGIGLSGANGTSTQTTYDAYFTNTHTGTASTNVGLYASASGGTNNYAAIFNAGYVGIGTTTPAAPLHITGEAILGNTGLACSSTTAGGMRYNTSTTGMEYCNGSAWSPFDPCTLKEPYYNPNGYSAGWTTAGGMWGDGTYLYSGGNYATGGSADLEAFTFNNATQTWTNKAHTAPANALNNIWGDGTYIYITEGTSGIQAYTFNGTAFTLKGTYNTTMNADWIWGDGTYIYVADDTHGLKAFTFNGTTFTLKATATPSSINAKSVMGDGTYIYVADYGNNVARAYTFNGTTLTYKAATTSQGSGNVEGVWPNGTYIYVVTTNGPYDVQAFTFDGTSFTLKKSLKMAIRPGSRIWEANGNFYLTAATESSTEVYSFNGTAFTLKGTIPSEGTITGMWADANNIYMADTYTAAIFAYPLCH